MDTREINIMKMDARQIREKYSRGNTRGRVFFTELREAIKTEYEERGYCTYIDELLADLRDGSKLYVIELAVLHELDEDKETNPNVGEYVPYIVVGEKRYTWDARVKLTIIDKREVCYRMKRIKASWQGKHQRGVEKLMAENEKLKKELEKISMHQTLEQAKMQADDIIREARRTAEREAKEIREDALEERAQIISEAEKIKESSRSFAIAGREESTWDGETANSVLDEYLKKHLQELRSEQKEWEAELRRDNVRDAEIADRIHGQMCDMTNSVQAQFGSKLNETIESLRSIESDFFSKLYAWQVALYPRDMEKIARHYINLYNAANIDKIVKAETVFQISQGGTKPSLETVEALEKLEVKLQKLLRKYEQALKGIGLYVQFPQEGELFDDVVHSCDSEPNEPTVITRCITPAIIHKMEGEGNEKTVIRAEVEVRTTGKDAMSNEYYNV